MAVWDAAIDGPEPTEEYKAERRAVLARTFDRLAGVAARPGDPQPLIIAVAEGVRVVGPESHCFSCVHRVPDSEMGHGTPTCAAFPHGIPGPLFDNDHDHRRPYPGDRDIHWRSNGDPFPEKMFEILRRLR